MGINQRKRCGTCKLWKAMAEFHKNKNIKDGHSDQCKLCRKIWQQENREHLRQYQREYNARPEVKKRNAAWSKKYKKENKEKIAACKRSWVERNKERNYTTIRKGILRRKFNITLEEYDQLFEQQQGVCAICGLPELMRRLAIDHDHKTGRIRGLLCINCNTAIGRFDDNPETLERAIKYLKKQKLGIKLEVKDDKA